MGDGNDLSTNRSTPVADFTSSDFDSIKQDLTAYSQGTSNITDFNQTQPAVFLLDLVAYMGDLLDYKLNAGLREMWAATVLRRQNLGYIGKPYGYIPPGPQCATVSERFTLDPLGAYPFTIDRATTQVSNDTSGDNQVFFQPVADVVVSAYPGAGYVDVDMVEGEYHDNVLIGVSSAALNQRWQFPQQSVIRNSVSVTVNGVTWALVTNWVSATSTSQIYKLVQNDDGNTYVVFGDNIYGAVPPSSAEIRASFRSGGGRRGNLAKGTITRRVSVGAQVLAVTNPAQSDGGDEALPMKLAREGIPAAISTLKRAVTDMDYELLSEQVSGVSKARAAPGQPNGSNRIQIWLAPSGGGPPTATLKNSVSVSLKGQKMVGRRTVLQSANYKNIRFTVLLHINENYRAPEVQQVARSGILNTDGTGLLNFAQLDFEGITKTVDGNVELLLSQTRLQAYFDSLKKSGLDRAEILQFDVAPVPRIPSIGNSGNGTLSNITLQARQRRREYVVQMLSSVQYVVYERIIGRSTSLTDISLFDHEKDFGSEGIASYAGYVLVPNRDLGFQATVVSANNQEAVLATAGLSLFTLTEVGLEYYMYNPVVPTYNLGDTFTSADGSLSFVVTAGSSPFLAGDSISLDIFPNVGDIRLRFDEYPELDDVDFVTRLSGGSRI